MERVHLLRNQLAGCPFGFKRKRTNTNNTTNLNEPVIIYGIRSPIIKTTKDNTNNALSPELILSQLLKAIISNTKLNPSTINDIIIGNALQNGAGFLSSKAAAVMASIPHTVPVYTVNRLCNSGLQAIINAHSSIKSGITTTVIAGGIEAMTAENFNNMLNPNLLSTETTLSSHEHKEQIHKLLTPMGITNENICELYNIPRYKQDQFAYESHMKATKAFNEGKLSKEIQPITTSDNTIITQDNIIRPDTNITTLSKLKPVFKADGTTTAGNSSSISIGGALCLLTTKRIAKEMKISTHVARIVGYAVVGVPPEIMGIGPSQAIPAVLSKCNLTINDIDIFEINEAFAGQALYCIEHLNLPKHKVNIHGGAIALGHPLGCTGARMVVSLLNILHTYKKKRGLISMCVGTGMGAACIIERELL